MRTRRWFGVSVLTLVVAAGFTISGSVTAAASSTSDLYVDNTASAHCSDAGGGTITRPFCTIGAASGAVRAGQTVIVTGTFDERLIAKRSGQPGAPITFQAGPTGAKLTGAKAGVTIRYRHDVDVAGFDIAGGTAGPSILVGHSSRITIKDVNADATASASPAIDMVADQDSSIVGSTGVVTQPATGVILDAGTSHVTVRGFNLQEDFVDFHAHVGFDIAGNDDAVIGSNGGNYTTTGIVVERAADHTVIANSTAIGSFGDGIVVKGNGTDITNNIIAGNCWSGIHVEATATHTTIENNVVSNNGTVGEASHCTPLTGGPPVELGVYGAATSSTTEDYNTVDDEDVHIPLYAWKTPIATLAAYRIASGQGAHDIFTRNLSDDPGNPDYDSADSAAPGFQQTDSQGNPREDDPDSPNTGAGPITYADRGIYELDHGATVVPRTAVDRSTKTVTVDASDSTPGWSPIASYTFDFADGTKPVTQKSPVAHHTYRVRTTYEIKISVTSKDGFASNTYTDVQLGSDFVAVTPVRILDTRTGIGTGKNPLPAHFVQDIYPVGRSPIPSGVTGLLLDLTVLNGTKSGSLAAFDTDGPDVPVSNVHWKAGQTASNLVTVPVTDGGVGLRNSSSGRVDVIVDVVGYDTYAPGSFYHPAGPVRVLETKTPVQPHSSITLATAGNTALPASGVTSVLLSVTASNQKAAGSLTVYPDGTARPSISNVHWSLTQATTDLVVVPVINGKINFYNASSGTTDISADLIGYFATTPSVYSTDVPGVRVLDTRSTPVPAHTEVTLPTPVTPLLQTAGLAALILNVTVTSPTKSGNLVVYPDGQSRPAASNLSWSTGQTISDLVIVPVVNGKIHFYNNSSGTVAILADLEGSFGT